MPAETTTATKPIPYIPDLFRYNRRKTRAVFVGDVGVGGNNPIRIQSMTTTPTTDVEATVKQTLSLVKAGCEIVRITAPTLADARALGEIKKRLMQRGCKTPLVADIHFNPECAMEAANHVEKVRINPGNYADAKAFKVKEYTDAEYSAELARIEERFTPLVLKLKQLGRSLRIGSNHGSLSDRIMNRYGDSPEGMVESALEFVRICEKNQFYEIILSMKSSNPKVMIAAYRLLAARMVEENTDYPFHLGVTEAGYGEDGRIKSAIGIGSLLNDGIGDTIRVSLTEDPEYEVPVAFQIAQPYQPGRSEVRGPSSKNEGAELSSALGARASELSHVDNFYHYSRWRTRELRVGPFRLGGENVVRVISDFSPWLKAEANGKAAAVKLLQLLEGQLSSGKDMVPEIIEWPVRNGEDLKRLRECYLALGGESSRLALLGRFHDLELALEGLEAVHLAAFMENQSVPNSRDLGRFVQAAKKADVSILLEVGPVRPIEQLQLGITVCEQEHHKNLLLSFNFPRDVGGFSPCRNLIASVRLLVAQMRESGMDYPIHLKLPGQANLDDQRIEASVAFGSLLCDGIGDSVQIDGTLQTQGSKQETKSLPGAGSLEPRAQLELIYNVLQGAGVRITKTEFVSCPSCGRTLFDLQSTTERIKKQTEHLKGVKIAIMGCIVNGPGEMADADFGYVGGAPGKINLYVGKDCVEKGIPTEQGDRRLIELIKAHGKWVDPK
jgi:(E)-4-hydroxy-3-methylbut-2-enyl-diphosphate synthase